MTNICKVLRWRWSRNLEDRARWEVWKYNTFGSGMGVYRRERAYEFCGAPELHGEPLHINDPTIIAGLASIIAEMEGKKYVAMLTPLGRIMTKEDVERQETEAIDRVVRYHMKQDPDVPRESYQKWFKEMLEKLKQYHEEKNEK